ncbi:MAG: PKD domain-containing protein, partial [Bacteroidetes bacterium]|nr:PKD domain-containing protein [Bacteroidota bacterium]
VKGRSYNVGAAGTGGFLTYQWGVWIDWNNDGDFSDAGEHLDSTATLIATWKGKITIPSSVAPGSYRLRIRSGLRGGAGATPALTYKQACGTVTNINYGEAEDYLVTVINPPKKDLSVDAVVSPSSYGCGLSATQKIGVSVTSWGTDTLKTGDTIKLAYSLNSGAYVFDTLVLTANLNPYASMVMNSKKAFNLSATGSYDFKVYNFTRADSNRLNDTLFSATVVNSKIYTIPYSQNFEAATLPSDWINDPKDGGYDWILNTAGTPTPNTGPDYDHTLGNNGTPPTGHYMYVDDGTGAAPAEFDSVILLTPCIDISKSNNPYLSFWIHSQNAGGTANKLDIDIISNGVLTKSITSYGAIGSSWTQELLSIKGYKGTIRIRFRVNCKNGGNNHDIAIDDMSIYDQYTNDVGVAINGIVEPATSTCGDSNTTVKVLVNNYGLVSATNVPVKVIITHRVKATTVVDLSVVDTLKRTIAAGGSDTLTHEFMRNNIGVNHSINNTLSSKVVNGKVTHNVCGEYNYDDVEITIYTKNNTTLSTAGGALNAYNRAMVFDALTDITIDSVTFYPTGTGKVGLTIYDATGNKINYVVVKVPTSKSSVRMAVNIFVPKGTGYLITADSTNLTGGGAGLYRNQVTTNPYPISSSPASLARITGNNVGAGNLNYYWFYNWKVSGFGCTGAAATVTAKISNGPSGGVLAKGTVFHGNYSIGSAASPDSVCTGDTLDYVLNPPTGYTNSDYSIKWSIKTNTFKDISGTSNTDMKWSDPSSSSNGKFSFYPKASAEGTTFVQTLVIGDATGCDTTMTRYIYVNSHPKANFGFTTTCAGTPSNFIDSSTFKGNASYAWDYGDGNMGTTNSHVYKKGGNYKATMTISTAGCSDKISKTIMNYDIPVVNFYKDGSCVNAPTNFYDSSSLASGSINGIKWSFGDGGTSTKPNPVYTYGTAGTYDVKHILTSDKGCKDSVTKQVVISSTPTPGFTMASTACSFDTVSIKNTTIPSTSTYMWDFGDGTTSTSATPLKVFTAAGKFSVTIKATNTYGCVDSLTKSITVTKAINPQYTYVVDSVTNTVTFKMADSSGSNYSWDFGDGKTGTTKNPVHAYAKKGVYKVKLTAISGTCTTEYVENIGVGAVGINSMDAYRFSTVISPNPFSNTTNISYSIAKPSNIRISVLDITGRQVAILVDKHHNAGEFSTTLNGTEYQLPAGIYMVRFELNNKTVVRQIVKLQE